MMIQEFTSADLSGLPAIQPADWGDLLPRFDYFLRSERCFPVCIKENNALIAVGARLLHGSSVWLACIIVHPDHRNRGLGNLMTKHLVQEVDGTQFPSIYLDATEFGFPVYQKLGFQVETYYQHLYAEKPVKLKTGNPTFCSFREEFRNDIYKIDSIVSGEDRSNMIDDYINSAVVYRKENKVQGFYLPSWCDGPVMSIDDESGLALLQLRASERDYAAMPEENETAISCLKQMGFKTRKLSRRMYLGKQLSWKPEGMFNRIAGKLG